MNYWLRMSQLHDIQSLTAAYTSEV